MRGCGGGVRQVLIGLDRVGVEGLNEALTEAETDPEAPETERLERAMAVVSQRNYLPEKQLEEYRRALLREIRRRRGEDLSQLYSRVDVELRAEPGEAHDRFVGLLRRVFAGFELEPQLRETPPGPGDDSPALLLRGEQVIAGNVDLAAMQHAVRKAISGW